MHYVFLSEKAREREAARLLRGVCRSELDELPACDALVLPIPLTRDGRTVQGVTKGGEACTLDALSAVLRRHSDVRVIAYAPHDALAGLSARYLEDDERFMLENARLCAEGGLSLLLSSLEGRSLADFSVFLLGYGRIARALLSMLPTPSQKVTVYARRASALRSARRAGCSSLPFSSLAENAGSVRFSGTRPLLINTVPDARVLASALDAHSPALLLELACTKEVTALCERYAERTRVLSCASMPTRYAPISAGRALAQACRRLVE